MKTIKLLFVCMLASLFAYAQENVPTHMMTDVEVTPPKFTAVKYNPGDNTNSLKTHIANNFKYDAEFGEATEGTEVVRFTINTDGSLSDIEVVNSVSPAVDKLLLSILEETNNMWMPGKNNGVPVAMEKEVAIQVKLGMTESVAENRDFTEIAREHFTKGSEKLFFDQKTRKAIKHFETAVRYRPYDQSALYMLALCEADRGNIEAAQEYVDRFSKLGGDKNILEQDLAQDVKSPNGYELLSQLFATK